MVAPCPLPDHVAKEDEAGVQSEYEYRGLEPYSIRLLYLGSNNLT